MAEDFSTLTPTQLKNNISEGEYQTLLDWLLNGMGRIIEKLSFRSQRLPLWVGATGIATLICLVGWVASLLTGGVSQYGYRTLFLGGLTIFLTLMIPRSVNQRTLETLHDQLLDSLESNEGLASLHNWLRSLSSWKWPILSGLLYVLFNLTYGHFFLETTDAPVDIVIVGFSIFIIAGTMLYYLLLFLFLPGRLSRCHYKLNAWDPVSSEVVSDLSGLFNYIAYMVAFLLAVITLFTISLVTFEATNLLLAIPTWLVLIAIFVASQIALSRIIKRSKRESLNRVEAQMARLSMSEDPPDKETLETLMRTWDYHERIKGTRDSVLNIKGILNFINTLLIPLLAFLIANRNEIFELLGWAEFSP
jgi:hypothetical protein